MKAELAKHGVTLAIFDGVMPDPTIEQIEAGVSVIKGSWLEGNTRMLWRSSMMRQKVNSAPAK